MSLQRGEGPHARALLVQIAQAFPQAIYYSLRTMVLCLREFAFKVVQVSSHSDCIQRQVRKLRQLCIFAFVVIAECATNLFDAVILMFLPL